MDRQTALQHFLLPLIYTWAYCSARCSKWVQHIWLERDMPPVTLCLHYVRTFTCSLVCPRANTIMPTEDLVDTHVRQTQSVKNTRMFSCSRSHFSVKTIRAADLVLSSRNWATWSWKQPRVSWQVTEAVLEKKKKKAHSSANSRRLWLVYNLYNI